MSPLPSLQNLIRGAVDYAGLFPPAGLPIDEVVANYATYLDSDERAMLGRLIIPAMKLAELEKAAGGLFPTTENKPPWRISALVPPIEQQSGVIDSQKFDTALAAIETFNKNHIRESAGRAVVDAIEVNTPSIAILNETMDRLPAAVNAFLEIPHKSDPGESLQSLAQSQNDKHVFAKIRTGGVTAELIPSTKEIARFIATCVRHGVGFKATAGLHHPIRGDYRLTYEEDSAAAMMHGFLNVFFAAVIAFEHKISDVRIEEMLSNTSPGRFVFTEETLAWDDLEVSADHVAEIRDRSVISFGSCSFMEPTRELQLLPDVSYESVFAG